MSKVSVIIPVYNVVDYIELCLRSIMVQTHRDLEILVCDDGSNDGTGEICDRLAAEDARIRVIHQENQGVSAARNACLDVATGEFIATIDSDDLVVRDYIERMVCACNENDADAALCDYCKLDEAANVVPNIDPSTPSQAQCVLYSNTECLEHMYHPTSSGMNFAAGFKVLRRSLFEEHHIRYPVNRIHEDQAITPQLIYYTGRVAYLPLELYGYRIRTGSIMHREFYKGRLDILEATRRACDFFLEQQERDLAALAVNNHIRTAFSVLACLREMHSVDADGWAQDVLEQIQADCKRYLGVVSLSLPRKSLYRLAAACPAPPLVQRLRMF